MQDAVKAHMTFKWFISLSAVLILVMTVSTPAKAQQTTRETTAAEKKAALAAREAAEARIDADMVKMSDVVEALSKNLGQLHYLRRICFGEESQKWRDYAGQMLNLEAGSNLDRREALTRAFNAGYFQEQARHINCSKNVSADAAALAENSRRLASMLGDPYRDN